jgi:hypothetical protein
MPFFSTGFDDAKATDEVVRSEINSIKLAAASNLL